MTREEARVIVMKRHKWSSAHLLCKQVVRMLAEEIEELLNEETIQDGTEC
jgi:hypothetical protein